MPPRTSKASGGPDSPSPSGTPWSVNEAGQDGMRAKAAELWKDEGYITTTDVGGLVGTGPYRTAFKRRQRRAGITDEIVPYELRHTLTSMLMDKGIRDTDISDILGHKDPRILDDTYCHLMVPEIDPHEEALADIFVPSHSVRPP